MYTFSREELVTLAKQEPGIGVSLYMPLHPKNGERRQDVIRLRNLLKDAEQRLKDNGLSSSQVSALLDPAQELVQTLPLEDAIGMGMAIFITPAHFRIYHCPLPFRDQVVVGQQLFIKPLLPLLVELGTFYVLALSENHVTLLRGTHQALDEIPLPDAPHSLKEALQFEQVEKQHQVRTIAPVVGTGSRMALFYGQGQVTDDRKERLTRFFAMVNRGVNQALKHQRAPLILASVDYLVPLYRSVNDNPDLCAEFIPGNPEAWRMDELHHRAWEIARSRFQAPMHQALARYQRLGGTKRACQTLKEILLAAFEGRIETLFLQDGADAWGYFHPETGALSAHEAPEGNDQELWNLAAIQTLFHEGQVYVLAEKEMPVPAAAAAVLRYS